jgi:hypothetical protein
MAESTFGAGSKDSGGTVKINNNKQPLTYHNVLRCLKWKILLS